MICHWSAVLSLNSFPSPSHKIESLAATNLGSTQRREPRQIGRRAEGPIQMKFFLLQLWFLNLLIYSILILWHVCTNFYELILRVENHKPKPRVVFQTKVQANHLNWAPSLSLKEWMKWVVVLRRVG